MENRKIILVTGASRGIGRDIAYTLAKDGNKVIANYTNSENKALELKNELNNLNIDIDIFKADVSKRADIKKMVEYIISKYGKIDILINNAGISQTKLFTDITDEDFYYIINNNLYSVFCTTQEVVKYMISQKNGCIINISSIWGLVGASCESHYSISKAGIDALTKSLAKELGPSNIRINSIAPGTIQTEMDKEISDDEWNEIINQTPLRKRGLPKDISKCVRWLIEDEFTTGQIISPNGGWIIT